MSERKLVERPSVKLARSLGCECVKLDVAARSWPDYMFVLPGGRVWFVEFKAPGKKPRRNQQRNHEKLAALGHTVDVVDSFDDFRILIRNQLSLWP